MKTYFFYSKSQQAIKIGRSERPEGRLSDMRTACPDVEMCGHIEGDMESHYHEQFKSLRIAREWFKSDGALADFVRASFKFKLPYYVIAPDRDSLVLTLDDLSDRSGAMLITHAQSNEFFDAWYDLTMRELPDCEDEECVERNCELCEEEALFREAAWDIEKLWDQVLGYSFRKDDDSYFRLVVVFWLPEANYAQTKLMERCQDLSTNINEYTELFVVDFFFVRRSGGAPLDLEELYYELNPERKAEREALQAQVQMWVKEP